MKKQIVMGALVLGAGGLMAGCASSGKSTEGTAGLPSWVMNPTIEGGIAATECVPASQDLSLDKAEATAKARATLVKQINLKVKAMDKTYQRKVKSQSGTTTGGTFESVSRQVADQYLSGSRATKVNYVDINGKRNLCAMVTMDPKTTESLFKELVAQSEKKLSPQDEEVLYEEFKAKKAQEALTAATSEE
ncbi:hypothetical protein [Thiohalorhabdus methylotrophus]|uniref:LPP20 lipoprotein n=1 Tax=Thiohalorhabdus methylotrophus TaxID=3242694 RepID=A0ABV4TW22_9GAMM